MDKEQDQDAIKLTRRQAVTAVGAGAVALTATHLGVAYEAAQWGQSKPAGQVEDLKAEVEKLRGLLTLYETLEKIGIDTVIAGAMTLFKGFLDALRGGVDLLRSGVTAAEAAISGFQRAFAAIRDGLKAAEDAVGGVAGLVKNAENWLGQTTTPLKPMMQQMRQFFDDLLGKIPFGVGDSIRKTIDGITGLVGAIPDMILAINNRLLEPLRTGWFSDDNAKNLQGTLIDPVVKGVFDPLEKFLGDVEKALAHWQTDVATPVQGALDQRAEVRKQIADYRQKNNLS